MRFYVYRILGEQGETVYIGKGSGTRLKAQCKRFMAEGEIVRYFKTEFAALKYEAELIERLAPPLNILAGGGGIRRNAPPYDRDYADMDRLGTRTYVARYLMNCPWLVTMTEERIADIMPIAWVQRHAKLGRWKKVAL